MVLKTLTRTLVLVVVVASLFVGPRPAARAAAGVSFTVTAKSAFLRAGPSYTATPMYSVFAGQTYAVWGAAPTPPGCCSILRAPRRAPPGLPRRWGK